MPSKSIYVATDVKVSFFYYNEIIFHYIYIYILYTVIINDHLGCCRYLGYCK